jgi:hypothetical protein
VMPAAASQSFTAATGQAIEPLTLRNMRELGVRSLDESCWNRCSLDRQRPSTSDSRRTGSGTSGGIQR